MAAVTHVCTLDCVAKMLGEDPSCSKPSSTTTTT